MTAETKQLQSGAHVRSSELVIPLTELVSSVNAFMEACDASGVKIPFVPCEILMWDLKTKVNNAEKALKGEAV